APETVYLAPQQNTEPLDLRAATVSPATALPAAASPATASPAAVSPAATPAGRSNRSIAQWFFGGVLVLAVLLLTVIHPSTLPSPEIRSIAVLPLQNLSTDMSQDYFTDGMTDELI